MFYLYNILCHLRVTPYRTITQEVNGALYTAPAKRGPKIGSRAYREHVIFSRPLFRATLNTALQIAGSSIFT